MRSNPQPLSILVVTDSYPPHVQGGAELSLSIVLSELAKQGVKVSVVKPSKSQLNGESVVTRHNGVDVYEISPAVNSPYPLTRSAPARFSVLAKAKGFLRRNYAIAKYLVKPGQTQVRKKLRVHILNRALERERAQYWTPMMDSDYDSMSNSSDQVLRLINKLKPDVVHADNYRAILLVGKLNLKNVATLAHVRDNRFFCPQRDQPMNIDGQICSTCDVSCTGNLPDTIRSRVGDLLASDRDFRRLILRKYSCVVTTSKFLDAQIAPFLANQTREIVTNPSDEVATVKCIQSGIRSAEPAEILIVGMLNRNKGQRNIVNWIIQLREQISDFRFVLAGRGQMENALKEEARRAGVADHLYLPGFLSRQELYRCYARATIVVAPNVWPEPFGRVPLEAALSSKPVIAYDSGGPSETIVNEETGILVPHGDEEQLISAIVELLHNSELREQLGRAALARVQKKYSVEASANALLEVWKKSHSDFQTSNIT